MEKPILENYETRVDVDEFVLTESGREKYEIDLALYQEQQEEISDCEFDFRFAIDEVIKDYIYKLPKSLIEDALDKIYNEVCNEL